MRGQTEQLWKRCWFAMDRHAVGSEGVRGARRWWTCACLLIVWVMTGTALSAQEVTPSPGANDLATPDLVARDYGPLPGRKAFRLAFLNPYPDNAYWQAVQAAIEERAAKDAVTVEVFVLDSPSVPVQVDQISEVIAQGYDGILLGAVDPAGVVPGIVKANEAGLPVLAIDTQPDAGEIISLVQVDNVAAAQAAGEFIAGAIGGKGNVVDLQGDMDDQVAQDRDQGLHESLDRFPDIAVESQRADWDRKTAASLIRQRVPPVGAGTPASEPGFGAIFAANDAMALGAFDALKETDQNGVIIVGFGGAPEALKAIAAGDLAASVAPLPTRAGAIAVDLMVRHLNGEPVPLRVDPGFVIVTAKNVDQFAK
jgi:ribose transport system substrate-binding protein